MRRPAAEAAPGNGGGGGGRAEEAEESPLLPSADGAAGAGGGGEGGLAELECVGFWVCGLLNNFAYVVFLTAAEDLLTGHSGAVLLANILPGLLTKAAAPFCLAGMPYSSRIQALSFALCAAFLLVANQSSTIAKLLGIALGSAASGLGEATFLALCGRFSPRTVGAWSSGTGGAGLAGAGAWILLRGPCRMGTAAALNLLSPVPLAVAAGYAVLIAPRLPDAPPPLSPADGGIPPPPPTWRQQLDTLRPLAPAFMLPLFLVYYFEYLINQAMFFPAGLAVSAPGSRHVPDACHLYARLQFLYQVGVLASRSSSGLLRLRVLWPLPALQALNAAAVAALLLSLGDAGGGEGPAASAVLCALVLWEGLLGGATYVNAFTNLAEATSKQEREFAMGITSLADSVGICVAALSSLALEGLLLTGIGARGDLRC
eukprot:jgi/Tetstr1/455994/TSEL_042772.t1